MRKHKNKADFKGNAHMIQKRANKGNGASERDSNKTRNQTLHANESCAATERGA
jgi:hypothetical protein